MRTSYTMSPYIEPFAHMSKSGIYGSYGRLILSFMRKLDTDFVFIVSNIPVFATTSNK